MRFLLGVCFYWCLFCGESGFLLGREVTKRAESSSFGKGRLEPKKA
ncbi:hypothetical protein C4K40_4826 [Pseudomonas sp. CMR5c]|nr:hypothetical protein C4K40_4826 [Pseudomonas sp. CMR5c]